MRARVSENAEELPEWTLWLSLNTENDNTAIWLEHKFDVPASGEWLSENVFSIPAFKKPKGKDSPGLIVFERTPLEGVEDEIERYVMWSCGIDSLLTVLVTLLQKVSRH